MADDSVKIKADTSQFKEAMQEVGQSMTRIRSEFRLAQSNVQDFGNKTETLQNRSKFLSDALEAQKQKTKLLADAYKDAAEKLGENSKKAQDLQVKLNQAQAAENNFARDLQRVNEELRTQGSRFTQIGQHLSNVGNGFKSAGDKMSSIGGKMTSSFTMPVVSGVVAAVKSASDLNETISKVGVVFGDNSKQVEDWGNTSITNFGLAKGTALDMVSTYGDMASGMGLTKEQAASMGEQLVGRAADLSSFKNISTDVAKTALTGIFTGEGESLKGLGVIMTQANLQQYAYSQGIQKKVGEMSQAEQVQLRYKYVMEQTKNAEGDFSRTSSGTANSMRIAQESVKQLQSTLAEKLLPAITPVIQEITKLVTWFGSLDSHTQNTILVIGGIVAAAGPVISAIGTISSIIGAVVGAFGTLSTAIGAAGGMMSILTGPIGIITAAIVGIVAVITTLWNTNEGFRNACTAAWEWIKNAFTVAWQAIVGFIQNTIIPIWQSLQPIFQAVWQAIVSFLGAAWNAFSAIFSAVVETLKAVWNALAPILKVVFEAVCGTLKAAWQVFQGAFTVVVEVIKNVWNVAVEIIKSVWSAVVNTVTSVWSAFSGAFQVVTGAITGVWNSITGHISNVWNSVVGGVKSAWESIKAPFQSVVNWISGIWAGIKSLFKLPHFTFSGSLNPLEWASKGLPKVGINWYSDGGIFTRPTVLTGVGDAKNGRGSNAEAVLPLNVLWQQLDNNFDKLINNINSDRPVMVNMYLDKTLIGRALASTVDQENSFRLI